MIKKEKTPHQQKAIEFGVSAVLIAQAQRKGALPTDIKTFSKDDDDFLAKLSITLANPKILKSQLAILSREKRKKLVDTAGDADLKRWESHALQLFINSFKEGGQIDSVIVLHQLHTKYRVQNNKGNRGRIRELRKVALMRVRREK